MTGVQQEPSQVQGQAQQCAQCGAALAADQRYCLNCGTRRGPPRAAAAPPPAPPPEATQPVTVRSEPRSSDFSPLAAVLGIALLGGMLLIGVLIGRGEADEPQQAPVVQFEDGSTTTPQATAPDAGSGETTEPASEIVSEWPAGTEGFTVRLTSTPKDGATSESVERLQADAESKGVSDVGVLDSDLYGSLPSGEWVVYSGVDSKRADAAKALSAIQTDFPDAGVIEISTTAPGSASGNLERGEDVTNLVPSEGDAAVPAPTEPEAELPAPTEGRDLNEGG